MQALFIDTIRAVCAKDYTEEQIEAWTASVSNIDRWEQKLASQNFLVARLKEKIVGYASLENNNYLDFLYVHKDHQRQGIADFLYRRIENEALSKKAPILLADVSKTARPFFEKKGFNIVKSQVNIMGGIEIVNFRMMKAL